MAKKVHGGREDGEVGRNGASRRYEEKKKTNRANRKILTVMTKKGARTRRRLETDVFIVNKVLAELQERSKVGSPSPLTVGIFILPLVVAPQPIYERHYAR